MLLKVGSTGNFLHITWGVAATECVPHSRDRLSEMEPARTHARGFRQLLLVRADVPSRAGSAGEQCELFKSNRFRLNLDYSLYTDILEYDLDSATNIRLSLCNNNYRSIVALLFLALISLWILCFLELSFLSNCETKRYTWFSSCLCHTSSGFVMH